MQNYKLVRRFSTIHFSLGGPDLNLDSSSVNPPPSSSRTTVSVSIDMEPCEGPEREDDGFVSDQLEDSVDALGPWIRVERRRGRGGLRSSGSPRLPRMRSPSIRGADKTIDRSDRLIAEGSDVAAFKDNVSFLHHDPSFRSSPSSLALVLHGSHPSPQAVKSGLSGHLKGSSSRGSRAGGLLGRGGSTRARGSSSYAVRSPVGGSSAPPKIEGPASANPGIIGIVAEELDRVHAMQGGVEAKSSLVVDMAVDAGKLAGSPSRLAKHRRTQDDMEVS